MTRRGSPFLWGLAAGATISAALLIISGFAGSPAGAESRVDLNGWVARNLGHAGWLFAIVLGLYVRHLTRLKQRLLLDSNVDTIVELDQLSDVWIHLFIGIGVIWTAIGMRAALQSALADPTGALSDTAGSILQKLVDGGILLALTTTIVGGIGGYLMRLVKTLFVGGLLHARYQAADKEDVRQLLRSVTRIETALAQPRASSSSAGNSMTLSQGRL